MRTTRMLALALLFAAAASPGAARAAYDVAAPTGVTVTGRGVATADADALAFDVRLGARRIAPTATPAPGPQSLGEFEGAPRSLAASLTGAGATNVSIAFDSSLTGNDAYPFDVRGLLERPTHDRILSLVLSGALATLPDGSPVPVQSASGALIVRDCAALEARADAAAFDDAHRRAAAIAAHAHLALGAVRALTTANAGPACARFDPAQRPAPFGGLSLPLDGPYRVTSTRDVTVTFAIR